MEEGLTHLNTAGEVHMVDVGDRRPTKREATARGSLQMKPTTLELIVPATHRKVISSLLRESQPYKQRNGPGN